jgi:hypothetical protein
MQLSAAEDECARQGAPPRLRDRRPEHRKVPQPAAALRVVLDRTFPLAEAAAAHAF